MGAAHLVMPEGRKIRKRSDYIFRPSGVTAAVTKNLP